MILLKDMPDRSEKYKEWARCLKCHLCPDGRSEYRVEAHHENAKGHGTLGGKCSDSRVIPLCTVHHAERHYVGRSVWGKLDPEIIIAAYRALFIKQGGQQFWRDDENHI